MMTRPNSRVGTTKTRWLALTLTILVLILMYSMPLHARQSSRFDLADYQWKNRVLIVFSGDAEDGTMEELLKAIDGEREAFEDRDMILIEVPSPGPGRVGEGVLDPEACQALRERFDIADEESGVVLIGKDGGTKLRRLEATGLDEVFALIDAMPMRRREMRRRQRE